MARLLIMQCARALHLYLHRALLASSNAEVYAEPEAATPSFTGAGTDRRCSICSIVASSGMVFAGASALSLIRILGRAMLISIYASSERRTRVACEPVYKVHA
jgi:hypothetical protein